MLIVYVYSPVADVSAVRWAVRLVVVPAITATGMIMWKLPALLRRSKATAQGRLAGV